MHYIGNTTTKIDDSCKQMDSLGPVCVLDVGGAESLASSYGGAVFEQALAMRVNTLLCNRSNATLASLHTHWVDM